VERVRDGEHELLLGRVVLVLQPVDARRRDDGQERIDHAAAGERSLEPCNVALEGRRVVLDRPRAEPALGLELRAGGRTDPVRDLAGERRVVLGVELRKRLPVPARRQDVARFDRHEPRLDPADPLVEIRDPVRLAHLAVVHDIDSGRDLAPDDVRDGDLECLLVGGPVVRLSVVDRRGEFEQLGWTNEATGVRGEDPVHQGSSAEVTSRPELRASGSCRLRFNRRFR
jgi:hypothetical protein